MYKSTTMGLIDADLASLGAQIGINAIWGQILLHYNERLLKDIREHERISAKEAEFISVLAQNQYPDGDVVNTIEKISTTAEDAEITILCLIKLHDFILESSLQEVGLGEALKIAQRSLNASNDSERAVAASCMAVVLRKLPTPKEEDIRALVSWIINALDHVMVNNDDYLLFPLRLLEHVMESNIIVEQCRLFPGFLKAVVNLLEENRLNLLYHTLLILWIMSFKGEFLVGEFIQLNVAGRLLDICKTNSKERIVRLSAAIWRNLYTLSEKSFAPIFIGIGLVNFIDSISQTISDEEALSDLKYLKSSLSETILSLSSFDEYEAELRSGCLDWSPPHKSELFWMENAHRFIDSDMELLRLLLGLLDIKQCDPQVVSIAVHDLGMIIKYLPNALPAFELCNGKYRIMNLISCSDAEVRYQALNTMQLFMKKMWSTNI